MNQSVFLKPTGAKKASRPRLAVLGGGPIGLEAALLSYSLGFETLLIEGGPSVATHVKRWKHVHMFSPWAINTTPLGREIATEMTSLATQDLFKEDSPPTGAEYIEHYLNPIAEKLREEGSLLLNTHVISVSRVDFRKNQAIGAREKSDGFVIFTHDLIGNEQYLFADIVIDATGCYWSVIPPGIGGLPPFGYEQLSKRFEQEVPDIYGAQKEMLRTAQNVLVVGSGTSATTTLLQLNKFNELERPDAPLKVTWFVSKVEPLTPYKNDPLPVRKALTDFARSASMGEIPSIVPVIGTYMKSVKEVEQERFHKMGLAYFVEYLDPYTPDAHLSQIFDEVFLHTGFIPDLSITRELQIDYCGATEGPMALLLSLSKAPDERDLLDVPDLGYETIKTSEPNFFIVGTKSYARNSAFLLKVGHRQLEHIFEHLLLEWGMEESICVTPRAL